MKLVKLVIFAKMGDFDSNYDFGTIDEIKDFFFVGEIGGIWDGTGDYQIATRNRKIGD